MREARQPCRRSEPLANKPGRLSQVDPKWLTPNILSPFPRAAKTTSRAQLTAWLPQRAAITLTALHLTTASILTQLLARYTSLIPRPGTSAGGGGAAPTITGRLYLRTILPIGLLYTMSLGCSNLAYLYLSVPFLQMLKALAPVTTLLMSWMASLADPRMSTLGTVLVIAFGVLLTGVGEARFVWAGFVVHSTSLIFWSRSIFSHAHAL